MKYKFINSNFISVVIIIIIFAFYRVFPKELQIVIPFILGVCFAVNIVILIYKRKYWEEILRPFILFITMLIIFINYYKSALKFDDSFMKVCLLAIGWAFPCLAYTSILSWKRIGDSVKYKQSIFFLVYCMILAILCTIVAI